MIRQRKVRYGSFLDGSEGAPLALLIFHGNPVHLALFSVDLTVHSELGWMLAAWIKLKSPSGNHNLVSYPPGLAYLYAVWGISSGEHGYTYPP